MNEAFFEWTAVSDTAVVNAISELTAIAGLTLTASRESAYGENFTVNALNKYDARGFRLKFELTQVGVRCQVLDWRDQEGPRPLTDRTWFELAEQAVSAIPGRLPDDEVARRQAAVIPPQPRIVETSGDDEGDDEGPELQFDDDVTADFPWERFPKKRLQAAIDQWLGSEGGPPEDTACAIRREDDSWVIFFLISRLEVDFELHFSRDEDDDEGGMRMIVYEPGLQSARLNDDASHWLIELFGRIRRVT